MAKRKPFNPIDTPVPYGNARVSLGPDDRIPDNMGSIRVETIARKRNGRFRKVRQNAPTFDATPRIKGHPDTLAKVRRAAEALEHAVGRIDHKRDARLVELTSAHWRESGPTQKAAIRRYIETDKGKARFKRDADRAAKRAAYAAALKAGSKEC